MGDPSVFENWQKLDKVSVSFAYMWYYLNVDNPDRTVRNCWWITPSQNTSLSELTRYTRTHQVASNKAEWKSVVQLSLRCDKNVFRSISNIYMRDTSILMSFSEKQLAQFIYLWYQQSDSAVSVLKHQSLKIFLFHILVLWKQLPLLIHPSTNY